MDYQPSSAATDNKFENKKETTKEQRVSGFLVLVQGLPTERYWAGYVREPLLSDGARTNRKGQLVLFTGECPREYCEGEEVGNPLLLPGPNSSAEDLNQVVCGATRKGILCGECSPGFGPGVNLFLAPCVHCATDPLSQVGWLLWLLLEALPLLLMLATFLVFDINLLAGPLNSYLLYAQFIAASFPISSVGPIVISNKASSVIVHFLYAIFFGIFNLQFFSFTFPPFCVSPGAASLDQLDVILIKTFTRLLPFTIILATIAMCMCMHFNVLSALFSPRALTNVAASLPRRY